MEPVFDRNGKLVAWIQANRLLSPRGRHVAFLSNNWVLSYRGDYIGRLYSAWIRDLTGAAVGFVPEAPGLPTPPATEPPPAPPTPEPAPVPPRIGLPPSTVRPMPVWSHLPWHRFVGAEAEDPLPVEPLAPRSHQGERRP